MNHQISSSNPQVTITGKKPGKKLVVFSAIHGNEVVGVQAINELLMENIILDSGSVTFVLANVEAYKQNTRQIDKNFNRYFVRTTEKESEEGKRLHELMDFLDASDGLLDIHAFNSPEGTPFIIGSQEMQDFASIFPFEIFSYGWAELEPNDTCDYMYKQGKPALCLECGSASKPEEYLELVKKSIKVFLEYFGNILNDKSLEKNNQKKIYVHTIGVKETNDFSFVKDFKEFEPLDPHTIFAKDGEKEYKAGGSDVIIFPRPRKPIGGEVFLLGTIQG